jgi:hypothetical protein
MYFFIFLYHILLGTTDLELLKIQGISNLIKISSVEEHWEFKFTNLNRGKIFKLLENVLKK